MRQIIFHDGDGRILRVVASETASPAQFGTEEWVETTADLLVSGHEWMILDGAVVPRPTLSVPPTVSLYVDEEWTLEGIPEGTQVLINNTLAGTTDENELTLVFPLGGNWRVDFRPPFPWVVSFCIAEVTE